MKPKQFLTMGAYLLVWPDKAYVNTADLTDCGYMENTTATGELSSQNAAEYSICKKDGTAYGQATRGAEPPEDPENGALWIDTSGEAHALMVYSSGSASWTAVPTVYVKISAPGIGAGFSVLDGVRITGCAYTGENEAMGRQIEALNGMQILYSVSDDAVVVAGLLDMTFSQESGVVTLSRKVPDMDFVTEAGNRLWGCKYGLVEGSPVNELYACALGDFKNWNQFLGASTDSWAASQGTDGQWTGAATHLGSPIFFKENALHKIYISAQGAHSVVTTLCRGVQKGSHRSLLVVNEILYYKSPTVFCAYDGTLPVSISDALGELSLNQAVAGAFRHKYYVSIPGTPGWLYVYDTILGFWHRESSPGTVIALATYDDELFALMSDGQLLSMRGKYGGMLLDEQVSWSAVTGVIGYEYPDQKRLSRFVVRADVPVGSTLDLHVRYDSKGDWIHVHHCEGKGLGTLTIPVRPRRCDHMQIQYSGTGDVRIYSIAKILETAGDRP